MQQTENVGLRVRRACGLLLLNRVGVGGDRVRAEPGQTGAGGDDHRAPPGAPCFVLTGMH